MLCMAISGICRSQTSVLDLGHCDVGRVRNRRGSQCMCGRMNPTLLSIVRERRNSNVAGSPNLTGCCVNPPANDDRVTFGNHTFSAFWL